MATCNSNVGMVVARQGKTLFDWLARNEIPYDELWFGKPHADVYLDDKRPSFHRLERKSPGDGKA